VRMPYISQAHTMSEKVGVLIKTLEALSELHDPNPYLGSNYCLRCSTEWPCDEAMVYLSFKQDLSES
jgi:hypothetical protein